MTGHGWGGRYFWDIHPDRTIEQRISESLCTLLALLEPFLVRRIDLPGIGIQGLFGLASLLRLRDGRPGVLEVILRSPVGYAELVDAEGVGHEDTDRDQVLSNRVHEETPKL